MTQSPFGLFRVTVSDIIDVTPSFRRVIFSGNDLENWADTGWDQRIKLIFPAEVGGYDFLPTGDNWYQDYLALPEEKRCPIRTYTTRAVHENETDTLLTVDIVRHQPAGPAASWVETASIGDSLMILGPVKGIEDPAGGVDFIPPAQTGCYLLGGDETAAPALARILEDLPPQARGIAVIELPRSGDSSYVPQHPGFDIRVLERNGSQHGTLLVEGIRQAAAELCPENHPQEVEEIDIDRDLLWEVPRTAKGGAALKSASTFAWLAGEASAVRTMRRHLVAEKGLDRRAVAFMGYWRQGRAES